MGNTPYIVFRRARFKSLQGPVNLPWGTEVEAVNGVLWMNGARLCLVTSQNAHDYIARNDDGNGLERGRLSAATIKTLSNRDRNYQRRWDRVWADRRCQKYRRKDNEDHWLWNHEFFEAPVEDLRYIAILVGAEKGARP